MKKILLSVLVAASLIFTQKASAQCNGVNVLVTNIQVNQTATHVVYSFNWLWTSGNPSINVIVRCGPESAPVSLFIGRCFPKLSDSTVVTHFVKDSILLSSLPACALPDNRTFAVAIRPSSNCNGNFCEVTPSQIPLPVNFSSFTAVRNRTLVNLTWTTASEEKNKGFVVERNVNGNWEQIGGFIPSQAVSGMSGTPLTYSYSDMNTTKGISQYRVRQVDLDGKSKISEIRAVRGDGQSLKTVVYPNPSNDGKVNIVFEDGNNVSRDIAIADMSGRTVKVMKGVTNNNVTIDNLTPGIYSLRIVVPATGEQSVEKIVVNKH